MTIMKLFFWLRQQLQENEQKEKVVNRTFVSGDVRVEWTGPSVRVRDGRALLHSQEMQKDLAAVRRLRERGLIES